jgi:transcription initiation factor IIE alpha subunit
MERYKCVNRDCADYNKILDEIIGIFSVECTESVVYRYDEAKNMYVEEEIEEHESVNFQFEEYQCPRCGERVQRIEVDENKQEIAPLSEEQIKEILEKIKNNEEL